MPIYEYRCPEGDTFESSYGIGSAPDAVPCPQCRGTARRRISAPHLSGTNTPAFRLLDSTARSASEPEIITSRIPGPPSGKPRRISSNPLHQKLPRP